MAGASILWYLRSLAAAQDGGNIADGDLLERFAVRQDRAAYVNQLRWDAGRIPIVDLAQSKFHRARVEIWLERAKAGSKIDSDMIH